MTHLFDNFIGPSRQWKIKKGWDTLFFNYSKIKLKIWVSYAFKAALVYRWPYRYCIFVAMVLFWKIYVNRKVKFVLE